MHVTHIVAHLPFREGTGTACYYCALSLQQLGYHVTVYTPHPRMHEGRTQPNFYRLMHRWLTIENAFLTPDILSLPKTDVLH